MNVLRRTLAVFSLLALPALAACPGGQAANGTGPAAPGVGTTNATGTGTIAPTQPAAPPHRLQSVEGITEYQLANGMRVLLFPDESQATVTINITYFVGSRHEGYGEAGMAHLLEHMVFKGTPNHPNIWKDLQDHGASFNGTTWVDRTNYYETLPASDENLAWALGLEADRMLNSNIDPEVLSKEFSVVRNEFEMGENNPVGVLEERITSAAFLWHNYGKSTIGNRSDIERVPARNLRRFYEKFYQPDNAMLVVAGRFESEKALEMINAKFGSLPKPSRELEPTYTVEPQQDGERDVTLRRAGDVQAFGVLYHGVPGAHKDATALDAIVHIMTNEPSGRLYKRLVAKKLATKVWGSTYPFHDPGVIQFFTEVPRKKKLAPVEAAMLAEIEGLGNAKITDAEVNRYKAKALKDWELAFTDSGRIAVALSEYAAMGDWRLVFIDRDRTEKLTTADVTAAAKTYLKRSSRTSGRFIPTEKPDRVPLIAMPDVPNLVKGYKGRSEVAAGEAFEATLANIEKRTTRKKLGNGFELAMLPKKTRGGKVTVRLHLRFGDEKAIKGKTAVAGMVPSMLMRGTKKHTYQQLKDELDRLKAQVSFGGGGLLGGAGNEGSVTIRTTRKNLAAVLKLAAEVLQQPSFPADQFNILKEETLTSLEDQKNNPQTQAFITAFRAVNPYPKGDVRYLPTTEEQIAMIKKIRLGDLKKLHATLYGASDGEMSIVGDFDANKIAAVVDLHFGKWSSKVAPKRIASTYKAHKAQTLAVNTPDKQMAMIVAAHTIKVRDDDADYAALTIAGYILGGGGSSRMMDRLRQKEGLSYGAFGGIQASSTDKNGFVFAGAICAPENAAKAMTFMDEEFTRFVKDGVDDKELKGAVAAYLEAQKNGLTKDGTIAGMLAGNLDLGRTTAFREKLHARMKTLTVAQVNAAIKKHIKTSRLVRVTAGDAAKMKAKK